MPGELRSTEPASVLLRLKKATYWLWGLFFFSLVFAALIVVTPLSLYRLIGNSYEAAAAVLCMGICLYAYHAWPNRVILLLAAFAFGEYAISTIFWYLVTLLPLHTAFGRPFVFTTVAELAFFGFMLFFIAGFQIERKKEQFPLLYQCLILLLFLAIPFMVTVKYGFSVRNTLLFIQFLVDGVFIIVAITRGFYRFPVLWVGICLRCVVSMLYGLRETLFLYYPSWQTPIPVMGSSFAVYDLMSIAGPLLIASIALLTIGLLEYISASAPQGRDGR